MPSATVVSGAPHPARLALTVLHGDERAGDIDAGESVKGRGGSTMTLVAMTASRGDGGSQVLVSKVHGDNRVKKAQTSLMDILQCLRKYGQRLDSEIAEETGVALAHVRERFALLTGTGEVITCKLTRFENGKPVDACLYRASGYFPPPAPGRKPKPPA